MTKDGSFNSALVCYSHDSPKGFVFSNKPGCLQKCDIWLTETYERTKKGVKWRGFDEENFQLL